MSDVQEYPKAIGPHLALNAEHEAAIRAEMETPADDTTDEGTWTVTEPEATMPARRVRKAKE